MLQGNDASVDRSIIYFEEFCALCLSDASDLYLAIMNPLSHVACVATSFQLRAKYHKFVTEQLGEKPKEEKFVRLANPVLTKFRNLLQVPENF